MNIQKQTNVLHTQKRKRLKMLFFFFFNKQLIEICKQVVQDVFL